MNPGTKTQTDGTNSGHDLPEVGDATKTREVKDVTDVTDIPEVGNPTDNPDVKDRGAEDIGDNSDVTNPEPRDPKR